MNAPQFWRPGRLALAYRWTAGTALILGLVGSTYLAAVTTATYFRATASLRALRLEIDPSSQRLKGSRLTLTLRVANDSLGRPLTLERLDVSLYLNGRFITSESVAGGVYTLRGGDRRAFELSVPLRPDQMDLISRQSTPREWRAEGLVTFQVPGMPRPVRRRVSTR